MRKYLLMSALATVGLAYAPNTQASEAMAKQKGCLACHSVNAKIVGPAYKDVAKKYKAADVPKLVNKVLKGGSGVWGQIPMPPNVTVNKAEAEKLVKWILSLKK